MKHLNLNPNILAAGVALALGLTAGNVNASTDTAPTNGTTGTSGSIVNTAEATYNVDGVAQPKVTSNSVTVNTSEIANFTLYATQGASATDDKNEALSATPGVATTFTNKLTNTGNLTDTYTLNITTNNDATITTGNQDYTFTNPTAITYSIKNANGTNATTLAAGQSQTGTVSSGGAIKLLPGQYADLSYALTIPATQTGGQSGVGTLTATSSTIAPANATLTNENQAIVKLPVFSIVKTASNTNINLNVATPTIDYTITVKNDGTATYAADAIGVLIQDKLPIGLSVQGGAASVMVSSTDGTTTNGTAPQIIASGTQQIIAVNGVDLKVGETMTIKFTALVDKNTVNKTAPLVNNADVYDNYNNTVPTPGDTPTADIKDSTSSSDPAGAKVPADSTDPTQTGGDKSTPITFSDRNVTLTGTGNAELPPTSSATAPAVYTHTITNNGNAPESGMTFTITDPNTGNNINVGAVTYDPTPLSPASGDEVTLTPNGSGVYTIPTALPNGTGNTSTISYTVNTTGAAIGSSEANTVTLTPAAVTGTTTPIVPAVTDTTTVQGMKLVKEQAVDAMCDGTADTAFAQTGIANIIPGQCVVYRITATNSMTTKSLMNVLISDTASQWNTKATYVPGSAKDSANGTVTEPGAAAVSSPLTLAPGGTGTLQFSVKINGAN